MKNTLRGLATLTVAATLALSGLAGASAADASYGVSGTPTTELKNGDTVSVTVTGLSGTVGVYAMLCKKLASQTATPDCAGQSNTAWITGTGAQGSAKDTGAVPIVTAFTTSGGVKVDCLVDGCIIYIRGDHNNSTDYSLIRTIPLTFAAGAVGVVKKADVATALLNNVEIKPNVPGNLTYREPVELVVRVASGLAVTLKSLTPDCAVDGTKVTALKGTGTCAIAATTLGNDTYTALSAGINFPFYLHPATQAITSSVALKKVVYGSKGGNIKASQLVSTMGERVTLRPTVDGICVLKEKSWGWTVVGRSLGTCTLLATAAGDSTKYSDASLTFAVKIAKK